MEPNQDQPKEQVLQEHSEVENIQKHEEPQKKGKKKFVLLGIVLVLIILAAGVVGFLFSESRKQVPQVSNNTPGETAIVSPKPLSIKGSEKTPKNYVFVDGNENIVVGDLKTGKETTVVKAAVVSKYWTPLEVQISPDGKYLTYLSIPKESIDAWEANPPIEIHGYDGLGVHVVDISDLSSPKDVVVANDASYGMSIYAGTYWLPDSMGFYYRKSTADSQVFPFYDIKNKNLTSNSKLPAYLESNAKLATDEKSYVAAKESTKKSDNSLAMYYNLGLYGLNGELIKTLYKDFQTSGYDGLSMIFANPQNLFLTREVYPKYGDPNSICYIDQININTATVANIETKNCPPGFSNTNYSNLKISPNGKYLSAAYGEDGPSNLHSGSIFLYDLKSGIKKTVGSQESVYSNYYWLSNDEILGVITQPYANAQNAKPKALLINVSSGEVSDYPMLNGKFISSVY